MVELRHLRYFVAVAEELHFGRAALRLHMAQPPLSQQIKRLEAMLGVQLFERNRRRVELTDAGQVLLPHARLVLAEVDRVVELTRRAGSGHGGRLTVGFVGSASHGVLPAIVREFREQYPEVDLDLRELGTRRQIEALRVGEIDLGLMRTVDEPWLEQRALLTEGVLAVIASTHPLAGEPTIALARLADDVFVSLGGDSYLRTSTVEMCRAAGFVPRVGSETTDIHSLITLVSAGLGVGIVPESSRAFRHENVEYVHVDGPQTSIELMLARRRTENSVPAARFWGIAFPAGDSRGVS